MTIRLLTYEQAGEVLGLDARTVRKLCRRGDLPRVIISERVHRIDADDLTAYVRRRREVAS